ncbi:hypothetical protein C9I92_04175 [Photobacterium ganghwense]|uniref:Uncharacterized protein n=1 Tax=Photobacterium ganghwense TaxID=320778 RepID=A0A0J1HHE4_9GAMM|nr:hypothetical protein ABT57_03885 [Photobacterium ganghwense]PSU11306.1 hypothetical protein C9I92_04175 [Photobacterium ganghwense]
MGDIYIALLESIRHSEKQALQNQSKREQSLSLFYVCVAAGRYTMSDKQKAPPEGSALMSQ